VVIVPYKALVKVTEKQIVKLTHWVALRPDARYFIISLCLTPDDFTHQGDSAAA
jgi:hypothetical protein